MTKVVVLIFTVLFALFQDNVEGNPLSTYEQSVNIETSEDTRTFKPESKDWLRFHHSWSLPSFPSFSMGSLFKDEDDEDITTLKKKIVELEKSQEELLKSLKKLSEATRTTSCDAASVPGSNNEHSQNGPENSETEKNRPLGGDIVNDKEEDTTGNTKKGQTQSVSETINGDSAGVGASADKEDVPPTKVDEKKETPVVNDDGQADAAMNGNEANETMQEDSEEPGLTARPEEMEKNAGEDLAKLQVNGSTMQSNEKLGNSEDSSTEDKVQMVRQSGEESDSNLEKDPNDVTPINDDDGGAASIVTFVTSSSNSIVIEN